MIARPLFSCLVALLVSCTSTSVAPEPDLDHTRAASNRPDLDFSFVQSLGGILRDADAPPDDGSRLQGKSLERATATFREALGDTEAFGAIESASAGRRLHCAFDLRRIGGVDLGGILFGLSLGLFPDRGYDEYELIATVTAPGREARTYRARTSSETWLWLPLAPIAIVQAMAQRGGLQVTVDSIATQMANDGWLAG